MPPKVFTHGAMETCVERQGSDRVKWCLQQRDGPSKQEVKSQKKSQKLCLYGIVIRGRDEISFI